MLHAVYYGWGECYVGGLCHEGQQLNVIGESELLRAVSNDNDINNEMKHFAQVFQKYVYALK